MAFTDSPETNSPATLPDVLAHLSKRWTPRMNVYGPVIEEVEKRFEIKEPSTDSVNSPRQNEQEEKTP